MRKVYFCSIALAGGLLFGADSGGVTLKAIPRTMRWANAPVSIAVRSDDALEIVSAGQTDWFVSPLDNTARVNSPRLLFDADAGFVLRAKVTVDFKAKWDAGVLLVYEDEAHWAKLCLENSVYGKPTIVSVVTRGASDDSNGFEMNGQTIYLQVARTGPAVIFYASPDAKAWRIIRAFTLGDASSKRVEKMQAGFSSQSPTGTGHRTVFSEILYRSEPPKNWWQGE